MSQPPRKSLSSGRSSSAAAAAASSSTSSSAAAAAAASSAADDEDADRAAKKARKAARRAAHEREAGALQALSDAFRENVEEDTASAASATESEFKQSKKAKHEEEKAEKKSKKKKKARAAVTEAASSAAAAAPGAPTSTASFAFLDDDRVLTMSEQKRQKKQGRKRSISPGALRPVRATDKKSYAGQDRGTSDDDEYNVEEPSLGPVADARRAWVPPPGKKRKSAHLQPTESDEEDEEENMDEDEAGEVGQEEEEDGSSNNSGPSDTESESRPRANAPRRAKGEAAAAAAASGSKKKSKQPPRGPPGFNVKHAPEAIEAAIAVVLADIQAIAPKPTPRIISLFTEKGGVGKTSSTLALGWALATAGRRVLIVDCDGQRSLSSWALGSQVQAQPFAGDLTAFTHRALASAAENALPRTLFDQMWSVAQKNKPLQPAHTIELAPRLHLVPGHRGTLAFDKEINRTEALGKVHFIPVNNVTGLPYAAVMSTANALQAEFVLLDLNPNAGDLNRVLISTSHYILMPTIPDFFCCELLGEFEDRLMGWAADMQAARPLTLTGSFPLPAHVAKFLGILVSRYQIRESGHLENGITNDKLANQEQLWLNKVTAKANMLVQSLSALQPPRAVQPAVYAAAHRTCVLGMYKDFHTLGDIAHVAHRPVPFLTEADVNILQDSRAQRENKVKVKHSKLIFMETAKTMLTLME